MSKGINAEFKLQLEIKRDINNDDTVYMYGFFLRYEMVHN